VTAKDVAVPIVFPGYLILVEIPAQKIDLPGPLPVVNIPRIRQKLPYLGHAGILFIDGTTGRTKYYEYGRYDPAEKGLVRHQLIPDVKMKGGRPVHDCFTHVLARISHLSGQNGRIEGAYIELEHGSYAKMLFYSTQRMSENTRPTREAYDLDDHSCLHFMRSTAFAGGASMPQVFDPRPAGYMGRVRDVFVDLDFVAPRSLKIEGITLP
jgi:hypothetical protein